MTRKTGHQRIEDSLSYLEGKGMQGLANDIRNAPRVRIDDIGEELSLGGVRMLHRDPVVTQERRALRALLLCQRLFLASRPREWKDVSIRHWQAKPEPDILDGIRLYMTTENNPGALAALAENAGGQPPVWSDTDLLTLARAARLPLGTANCFQSVMAWLLMSGLVSVRWYSRHKAASDEASLTNAFGMGHRRWPENDYEFKPSASPVPPVGRGYVVHLFNREPGRHWTGHWLVSLSGGRAAGCNNNPIVEFENGNRAVAGGYSNQCSIDNQFRGFKGRKAGGKFERGTVVEYNPATIPGRA